MLCDAVAIQSSAEPLRSLAYPSFSMHRPCFTSPTPASPLRFCARRLFTLHSFAIPCLTVLCLASATHCSTRPCRCFSGRIEATHFDTQPSRVTVSQYFAFAMRNVSQPLRCSTSSVSTFPLRCRDTHRPAKPLLFFWFQNRTQPILCSSWPCGAPPLRCYLCLASLRHSLPRITLLFLCCAEHC